MLTLHKATEETKQAIKWSGIAIIALVVLIIFIRTLGNIKEYFYPTPPPPPTVSFGKLPEVIFPKSQVNTTFTYEIDTLTGALPAFPDRANVNQIQFSSPNLLSVQRASERVAKVGFNSSGTPVSKTVYRWQTVNPYKEILLDVVSLNFTMTSEYLTNPQLLQSRQPLRETEAIQLSQNFFSQLISLPSDVGNPTTSLLSVENERLTPATSLSKSQIIRVDFYQKDIYDLKVYYPNPPYSVIYALVSGDTFRPQIVEAKSFYHILSDLTATYPIKTSQEAYDQLKQGKAYIASYYGTDNHLVIKNISLGYYLGETQQEFLEPIIVFEGKDGFFAYVPAIKDSWIQK